MYVCVCVSAVGGVQGPSQGRHSVVSGHWLPPSQAADVSSQPPLAARWADLLTRQKVNRFQRATRRRHRNLFFPMLRMVLREALWTNAWTRLGYVLQGIWRAALQQLLDLRPHSPDRRRRTNQTGGLNERPQFQQQRPGLVLPHIQLPQSEHSGFRDFNPLT